MAKTVTPPVDPAAPAADPSVIALIAMVRDEPWHPDGGPTTADVHPDEVVHWQQYGWRLAG